MNGGADAALSFRSRLRHFGLRTVPLLFHVLLKTEHVVMLNENKPESLSDECRLKP